MLCETCRWTERPGFVPRRRNHGRDPLSLRAHDMIPCPDCGGQAIGHCCDGICEQPEPPTDPVT